MFYLLLVCILACSSYLLIALVKIRLSLQVLRQESLGDAPIMPNQITIIQPILGGDPALKDMLQKTLQSTSALTRFLWLIDIDDEPGRTVAELLCQEHASRVEILWCDRSSENTNPKAYKLERALSKIETPYFAVLDDDTTISERNLRIAIAALDHADLYTGIPCYQSTVGWWNSLVTHFVNNNSITTYLSLLPLVGPLSINGMFYVMRTDTLGTLGGFTAIQDRLCDDYAVARLLLDNGRRIHQGVIPQYLQTSVSGIRHYLQIMHRWFVFADILVRDQRLNVRLLLLLMLGFPPMFLLIGLIGTSALVVMGLFIPSDRAYAVIATVVLGMTLILRHNLLSFLNRKVFDGKVRLRFGISILSELVQPIHWCHALLAPTIQWRTRRIRVNADNTFKILDW